ncbi:MAG: TIGR02757 family protein [Haliscomenobacter sp.]|nr:TIGR02757 family protein [Haliscomenobacter sp.]MBK7475150.1 TIGR02757 family protein [Haliscomenobacter sp.]
MSSDLSTLLEYHAALFNKKEFIEEDPIRIPHAFQLLQDIEIAAFWTAILAWGQRKTIINSATRLFSLMDNSPYDFVRNHQERDRKPFLSFKHRTFQPVDTLYFLEFFQDFYSRYHSLEEAFTQFIQPQDDHAGPAIQGFHHFFFSLPDSPHRTRKHVPTPESGSTCKRMNMFLRWMVRQDVAGVDFGLWQKIRPSQLLIPLDVHVDRVARKLGLIQSRQTDWKTVLELTNRLKQLDPQDPVRFDFALFGMGILEKKQGSSR